MDLQWIADKLIKLSEAVATLAGQSEKQNLRIDTLEDEVAKMQHQRDDDAKEKSRVAASWYARAFDLFVKLLCGALGAAATIIAAHVKHPP